MDQTRTVMSGHTVEKNRLSLRIGQKVGCFGHLLECRMRPSHRHNKPRHSCFSDDFGLSDVLEVVAIDRR
jgi:hypothetical protein